MISPRTLVAGIGNVFFGDDGFGVEVVRRLARRPADPSVTVADFGIRGLDLAYALLEHERAILVDAAPRGGAPGTLYVIEPDIVALGDSGTWGGFGHGLVPARALGMARAMGARLQFVRIVGCEPAGLPEGDELAMGLSQPVGQAIEAAVALVEDLLEAPHA